MKNKHVIRTYNTGMLHVVIFKSMFIHVHIHIKICEVSFERHYVVYLCPGPRCIKLW